MLIILKLGSGGADLALPWGSPLSRVCLAIPATDLPYDASEKYTRQSGSTAGGSLDHLLLNLRFT